MALLLVIVVTCVNIRNNILSVSIRIAIVCVFLHTYAFGLEVNRIDENCVVCADIGKMNLTILYISEYNKILYNILKSHN